MEKFISSASVWGDSLDALLMLSVGDILEEIAEKWGCHYLKTAFVRPSSSGCGGIGRKILLISGDDDVQYRVSGILADERINPLLLIDGHVLLERARAEDFLSHVSAAHSAVSRRHATIRGSMIVLAGQWPRLSVNWLRQNGIYPVLLPQKAVRLIFRLHGIDLDGDAAWEEFNRFTSDRQRQIGRNLIRFVAPEIGRFAEYCARHP